MVRPLAKVLVGYLVLTGVVAHVAVVGAALWALDHFQLTPRQFVMRAVEKAGLDVPALERAIEPAERFPDHVLDGRLVDAHPRVLLPALRDWDGSGVHPFMAARRAGHGEAGASAPPPCRDKGLLGNVTCWVTTGDGKAALRALGQMQEFVAQTPSAVGDYGNAWELALALDLLSRHPGLSEARRGLVLDRLEDALRQYLLLLDGDSASLWHGRTTLAAQAWVTAVVMGDGTAERADLVRRAQSHFLDVARAAALTEAWPEGYTYWINTRAFLFALASAAYVNGLEDAGVREEFLEVLRRIGLWHVYATRPDGRVEGTGDEGPRVDLKDETQRVIDLLAQLTRDRVLATFSRYIHSLHGREGYYRGYRWGFPLFNDPTVEPLPVAGAGLDAIAHLVPRSALFGRDMVNGVFMRSGWDPEATFISFRAGHSFTHHGHADAGHFTLFKGAPLAINSSTYGGVRSPNRLYYSMRTVAKNGLLVMRPGERVQPNRFFERNVASGGQRLPLPTGSAITSVADWQRNRREGAHLEGARLLRFDHQEGAYTYVEADLTDAYNTPAFDAGGRGGKVTRVVRRLLYVIPDDRLLVADEVTKTDADYVAKWLLHTVNPPRMEGAQVRVGSAEDGILESTEGRALVENGSGRLVLDVLAPEASTTRLVGGPNYRFYADVDGDDRTLDGENFSQGAKLSRWFDIGDWRLEVRAREPGPMDRFLVLLSPSLHRYRDERVVPFAGGPMGQAGYLARDSGVLMVEGGRVGPSTSLQLPAGDRFYVVVGVDPGARLEVAGAADEPRFVEASPAGIVSFRYTSDRPGVLRARTGRSS